MYPAIEGWWGSAVVRRLQSLGRDELLLADRSQLDLVDQAAVHGFFEQHRPEVVIFAAAKVGGIYANQTYPAHFIYNNLAMASNAIHAAWKFGTRRFLYLGSTCIYPRHAPQPIPESALLTSELEATNEPYALAKIAGETLSVLPTAIRRDVSFRDASNLYGPGDNYHPENSHVLPALIRRFHEARIQKLPEVSIWGTGTPLREFLHVDDLADGILHLLQLESPRTGRTLEVEKRFQSGGWRSWLPKPWGTRERS